MSYYNIGDSFRWFIGRVVDIKDEYFLGRVKIRVIHEQTGELGKKKENYGLNKDELLWAYPISAIQSASLSYIKINELEYDGEEFVPDWIGAVGLSPTGIAVGTYVYGFYLDGHEANIPLIFGTYHKESMYPEPGSNPLDMLQDEPPEDETYMYSDVSDLAKGYFKDELGRLTTGEFGGAGQTLPKEPYEVGHLWDPDPKAISPVDEMPTAYNTEYPYNTTYTTKRGHAIELDDTKGYERIHIWHRSGSYEEISTAPSNPAIDDDQFGEYPKEGPAGWNYVTAGGVSEPSWEGRRSRKTMDSYFDTVIKDRNELTQRDHNVQVANTETGKIGNTQHWTIGWQQPPQNRVNDNGKTNYNGGGIGTYNAYYDVANNTIQTTGNNAILQVGYDPKVERRFEIDYFDEKNYYFDVANNTIGTSANNYQLSVGYVKETERKLVDDEEDLYNYFLDVANNSIRTSGNNSVTSIGFVKETERKLVKADEYNRYLDVANNTIKTTSNNYTLAIGYNKDTERKLTAEDTFNSYIDVANNSIYNNANNFMIEVGFTREQERKLNSDYFDKRNFYLDVSNNRISTTFNNVITSVGYSYLSERKLTESDQFNYYLDVGNNISIRSNNSYVLNVGHNANTEKKLAAGENGSYYLNVTGDSKHLITGNQIFEVIGNFVARGKEMNLNAQGPMVIESGAGMWIKAGSGLTVESDVTLINNKTLTARLTAVNGATGSWTTSDGKKITVTGGIITDIS